jgi:hypothetical protein
MPAALADERGEIQSFDTLNWLGRALIALLRAFRRTP